MMRKDLAMFSSRKVLISFIVAVIVSLAVAISPFRAMASGQAPTADAGYHERVVYLGRSIELDGSTSSDPENDFLIFKWDVIQKPDKSYKNLLGGNGEHITFTPDATGQYTVRLIVNDGTQDSAPYDIQITSRRPLRSKLDRYLGRSFELRAGSPADPGSETLEYRWSITKRPKKSTASLEDYSSCLVYFTPDAAGVYEIKLDITDNVQRDSFSFVTEVTVRHYPCASDDDPPYPYGADKPWATVLCELGKGVPKKLADLTKDDVQGVVTGFVKDGSLTLSSPGVLHKARENFMNFFWEKTTRANYQRVQQSIEKGFQKAWPTMKAEAQKAAVLNKLKGYGKSMLLYLLSPLDFKAQAENCIQNIMFLVLDKLLDKLIDSYKPEPPTIVKLELGTLDDNSRYVRIFFNRSPGDSGPGKSDNLHYYYKLWRWSPGNKIVPLAVGKENSPYGPFATGPDHDQSPLVFYDANPPEGNNVYRIQAIRIIGKSQVAAQTWNEGEFWVEQLISLACPPAAEQISFIKTYTDRALKVLKALKFQKSKLSLPDNIYVPKPFERPRLPVSLATNYATGDVLASLPFTNTIYSVKNDMLHELYYCQFKDPHQVGLAIDSLGNVYADNAASDDRFGGRIFRWDKFGNRSLFGTVNYFSSMLGYARPCAVQAMTAGWAGDEKLFITDLYANSLKELVIPPTGIPENPAHYVAHTVAKAPQIEITNKTSMCLTGSGDLLLTSGDKIFRVTPSHYVEKLLQDTDIFSDLTGIDVDDNYIVYFADYNNGAIYAVPLNDLTFPKHFADQAYLSLHTIVSGLDRPGELRLTADQRGLIWFDGNGFHHHIFGLSARIVDSQTGEPLIGAIVSCEDRGTVQVTKTDALGVFHLPALSLPDFPQELSLLIRHGNQSGTYRVFLKKDGETFIDPLPFLPDEVPLEVSGELPQIVQPDPPPPLTTAVSPGEVTFYENFEVTIPGFQPPEGHEFPPQPPEKAAPPIVKIVNPVDGLKTVFDEIEVKGVVSDGSVATVELFVNGSATQVSVEDRTFSATIPIEMGLNHIRATASIVQDGEVLTGASSPVNVRRVSIDEIPETGAISGILVDRTTGYPASGIRVELVGTDKFAITDALGTWQISDVPAGLVTVQILP